MKNYTAYISLPSEKHIEKLGTLFADIEERENDLIKLYPSYTDQVWDGFGGAVTDSSAYVWSLMAPDQKDQVIDRYFGTEGLKYTFVPSDGKPEHFDVERPLRYILPMLEAIREKANIRLMLSRGHPLRYSKRTDKGSTGANASRKT